jgi:heme/copper-type cytochrome/quinol oxidase subunit 2
MKLIRHILFIIVTLTTITTAFAQTTLSKADKKKAKQDDIKAMVESQRYTFIAQYANPLGGGHRYLTSDYDLRIRKDSIIAYLPYFGRAYFDVPYNPSEGGIKFTSTKFTYKITAKKKGGWDVIIKPSDVKYLDTINMDISADGYTNVQFTITNKSAISFDGVLKDKATKK